MARVTCGFGPECVAVVPNSYGSECYDENGNLFTLRQLPICTVPIGTGRNAEQAVAIAEEIAGLINRQTRYGIVPAGNASPGHVDMECGG